MLQEEQCSELHELAKQIITRIDRFGSVEGFTDEELEDVLNKVKSLLEPLPAMIEISSPVIVFGDVHGQLSDLLSFIDRIGRPPAYQYLFLGDLVDRGTRSLEVIFWLFAMKILHPEKIHLVRGNHEIRRVNAIYGFKEEMIRKRSAYLWKVVNDVMLEFPICANINRKILCMHGGVNATINSWAVLENLKKPRKFAACEEGLAVDLLWADPNNDTDECKFNSARGISTFFSKTVVHDICTVLGIDLIIRAHSLKSNGHKFQFDNQLLTVFSAPCYCGSYDNAASVVKISRTLKLQVMTLKPKMTLGDMKAEKEHRKKKLNYFDPEDRKQRRLCQAYAGSKELSNDRQFMDNHVMYGHDTKFCQTTGESSSKSSRESTDSCQSSRKSKRKQAIPGKAVNLTDDHLSLSSIRRKLGIIAAKAGEDVAEEKNPPTESKGEVYDSILAPPAKSLTPSPAATPKKENS